MWSIHSKSLTVQAQKSTQSVPFLPIVFRNVGIYMVDIASDIENRPQELWSLPNYGCLPNGVFEIDLKGSIGEFLLHDIYDLDGTQPIEKIIFELSQKSFNGYPVIEVNPSAEAIEFYKARGDKFQMINVVVCCYAFEEKEGRYIGLPYHISLRPVQEKGLPASVSADWIEKIDLSMQQGRRHYMGYNPFSNAFGLFASGPVPINENICSDTIGFVYKTYFLASNYDKKDVCDPGMCTSLLGESKSILSDYRKFRFSRYFSRFKNIEPIKIWGCDSPIELFLLQAMNSLSLRPKIQMHIFEDGAIFPSLQSMWEGGRRTKKLNNIITEADFFFEEQKVAVFCDSVEFHTTEKAVAKDAAIDEKLSAIGIRSIRISGSDIVKSPINCAQRIASIVSGNA
jgi:hypothetical protein